MKSVMSHSFSQIPQVEIPRSVFDRSHGYKTTFDAGFLIPFFVDEALPGDTFAMNATIFARLATLQAPIMDNMFMETFYFAVPNRLVWENWQRFNGEQQNPGDSTDYITPQVILGENEPEGYGGLWDYFGLPTGVSPLAVSALYFRAYNLIWNEWFRDQNLQGSRTVPLDDGPDDIAQYGLLQRGKRHDYFTSALPWPQKGPAVQMPLGSQAPVIGNGMSLGLTDNTENFGIAHEIIPTVGEYIQGNSTVFGQPVGSGAGGSVVIPSGIGIGVTPASEYSGLIADLSQATAATINAIREAFQVQRLLERDARGGTRYVEIIKSHFGVTSPDFRLQRPEYLGGSSTRISVNPVQQTSSSDSTTPQGNLAAYGIASDSSGGFNKSFTEHCIIIGLVNVRADLTYQQGIARKFLRHTRWDYYWPALAHLGEQPVYNTEIFSQGLDADAEIFGYQERYAEYRYAQSQITGKFRSTDPQSLDVWHLSQEFGNLPALNGSFIVDQPPIDRVIAVPGEPHFLFDSYIQLHCARPMPVYSVPGMIDHF